MEVSVSTEEASEAYYIERMRDHLRDELADPGLDYLDPPRVVKGGMSGSAIYRFSLQASDPKAPWAARALICRAVGEGDLGSVAKEVVVQRTLHDLGYPVPAVLVYQDRADVLDTPFLIMEALPGQSGLDRFFWLTGLFWLLYFAFGVLDANDMMIGAWPWIPAWIFVGGLVIISMQWTMIARRLYRIPASSFIDQCQSSDLDPEPLQIESMLNDLKSSTERIDDTRLGPGLHWLRYSSR